MKAIRYHHYGGPEQLVLEEVPRPEMRPGTVLLRVKASGVNPWDWKLRSGVMQQFMPVQFPYTPGIELAGAVEEIGPEVTASEKGRLSRPSCTIWAVYILKILPTPLTNRRSDVML